MSDNDFGYFGNGFEGYAHYIKSFNNNFADDDSDYDNSDDYDGEDYDDYYTDEYLKNVVESLEMHVIGFSHIMSIELKSDYLAICLKYTDSEYQNCIDAHFNIIYGCIDVLKEFYSFFNKNHSYVKIGKIIEDYYEEFTEAYENLQDIDENISDKYDNELTDWYYKRIDEVSDKKAKKIKICKEKYLEKLKVVEDFISTIDGNSFRKKLQKESEKLQKESILFKVQCDINSLKSLIEFFVMGYMPGVVQDSLVMLTKEYQKLTDEKFDLIFQAAKLIKDYYNYCENPEKVIEISEEIIEFYKIFSNKNQQLSNELVIICENYDKQHQYKQSELKKVLSEKADEVEAYYNKYSEKIKIINDFIGNTN